MSRSIERFVEAFVRPLLAGGRVVPQPPYSTADRDAMAREAGLLASTELTTLRLLRARSLLPSPPLADPTAQELSMWLGLHNLTLLDHPQVGRVWTTARKWELVERETRALFEYARPVDLGDALSRHVAVSSLMQALRDDPTGDAEREPTPSEGSSTALAKVNPSVPARSSPSAADERRPRRPWMLVPHARVVARLWPVALWASPLTPMVDPTIAPPQWAPSSGVGFLRHRGLARAIVFAWARHRDWVEVGSVVAGAALQEMGLLPSRSERSSTRPRELPQDASRGPQARPSAAGEAESGASGPSVDAAPRLPAARTDAATLERLFAALIHLHVIKLLEFDVRVVPARDRATQAFLALPLLLHRLPARLGDPLVGVHDVAVMRRWSEHLEHLAAIVPGELVTTIGAALEQAPSAPSALSFPALDASA